MQLFCESLAHFAKQYKQIVFTKENNLNYNSEASFFTNVPPRTCGLNAACSVNNHHKVCTCPQDFTGQLSWIHVIHLGFMSSILDLCQTAGIYIIHLEFMSAILHYVNHLGFI